MRRVALIILLILTTIIYAEIPLEDDTVVTFPDSDLRDAVTYQLNKKATEKYPRVKSPETLPTVAHMRSLTELHLTASESEIDDLSGLEYAVNLKKLEIYSYDFSTQTIRNIEPLTGLIHLEELVMIRQKITNIQALETLPNLKKLDLRNNKITDISPLLQLHELTHLNLRNNPIPKSLYNKQTKLIRKNNPNLEHIYDPFRIKHFTVPIVFTVIMVGIALWIIRRIIEQAYYAHAVTMGIVSALVGGFLGNGAQMLYPNGIRFAQRSAEPLIIIPDSIGLLTGVLFGTLVGIIYICILKHYRTNISKHRGTKILIGMITGVLCSTLVHTVLMLSYRISNFSFMLFGAVFGLIAGGILGILTALVSPYPTNLNSHEKTPV